MLANDHKGSPTPCCRLLPVVWEYHGVSLGVQLDSQIGVQESSQSAQKAADIAQQLIGGHQDHNDERPLCQLLSFVTSAVETIPATLLTVTALVTAAIRVVICTILVIPGKVKGLRAAYRTYILYCIAAA